jgi:hypothetical protein
LTRLVPNRTPEYPATESHVIDTSRDRKAPDRAAQGPTRKGHAALGWSHECISFGLRSSKGGCIRCVRIFLHEAAFALVARGVTSPTSGGSRLRKVATFNGAAWTAAAALRGGLVGYLGRHLLAALHATKSFSQIATRTYLRYCSSSTCSIQSTFLPLSDS